MAATEVKTLIYWLNTLDLPCALLVDSLDDLRDGDVLCQLVSIGSTNKQTSHQHFDNLLLQRFSSIIAYTKALDSRFGQFIAKLSLDAVVSNISQGRQNGDLILLEILRALHRISTSSRRRGSHYKPIKNESNHSATVNKHHPKIHSKHASTSHSTKDASNGAFRVKRTGAKGLNLKQSQRVAAEPKQRVFAETALGAHLQGVSAILQSLHGELHHEDIRADLRATLRWLLLPPLLPCMLHKLEDAGVNVGPFHYVKKSECGLPNLLAHLFADGVLLCMIVAELERLAGSKLPFVEKHARKGKLVVLSGLELEPKTHGSKLRNVNISIHLLKKNTKVAARHLFSCEKLVGMKEPAIAYELLDDVRRAYKTPQSWRKKDSLSFLQSKLNLVKSDQSSVEAESQTGKANARNKRRAKKKSNTGKNTEMIVESLLAELKAEEATALTAWAARNGLIENTVEYESILQDPVCNGTTVNRLLGNEMQREQIPTTREEAEEVLASLVGQVSFKALRLDLTSEVNRSHFAKSLLSRGRSGCLLLLKAAKETVESANKPSQKKKVVRRSKADLQLLEESINAWLSTLGIQPKRSPSFLTSKELANGILLAKVSELILAQKIVGIFARPKTATLIAKNFEKSLFALRNESKISRRYLFRLDGLISQDAEVVLGLFEDLHRFHAGLQPRKELSDAPEAVFLGRQSNEHVTRFAPPSSPSTLQNTDIVSASTTFVGYNEDKDSDCSAGSESGEEADEFADIYPDTKRSLVDVITFRPSRDEFGWSVSTLQRGENDILPSSSGWWEIEEKENCGTNDSPPVANTTEEVCSDRDVLELCEQLHIKAHVRNIQEFVDLFVSGVRLCKLVEQVTRTVIPGVQLQPKSKAARLHNIRAALATLQNHRQMPSDHLWDEYEIESGNSAVLVGLLDQIKTAFPQHR